MDLDYINISEIESNAETALEKKYAQFELAEGISVSNPCEINIMKFRYLEDFQNNYVDALSMFFTKQEINAQDIQLSTDNTGSKSYSFWNEYDKMYGCVSDNGFIAMLKPDVFDISFACNGRNVKIYHVDRDVDLSDSYQLNNGEYSIGEAVDYINAWLEDEYKKRFSQYDYKVKTVIVREFQDHYLYEILIQQIYNGVPLDCITQYAEMDEKSNRMYMKYTKNNVMADAILNSKLNVAEKMNVQLNVKANVPEMLPMSDVELCSVLGNMLDNAVEACGTLPKEERFMRVYIGKLKGQLYLSVQNSAGKVRKEKGSYLSTKEGEHGYGLFRIDRVAKKYGGYVNRQNEEGIFATEIMIPLTEKVA